MRMIERVKEIIEANLLHYYIPLVVDAENPKVFPMYYGRIRGEKQVVFPATNATGIGSALKEQKPAYIIVADRAAGFEAYLLEGKAWYVSNEDDYDLVAEMRNECPSLPIHGAVILEVENVHLVPPP
jgi:hypothetical protein